MGKLTARGWSSKAVKITSTEASAFVKRCAESHTQQWRLDVFKYYGGELHTLATYVPIISGSLILDSSDPIRRRLQVEVGGGEKWEPADPGSALAPYGQYVNLYTRVDYSDGSWSPWLQVFSGQIQSTVFERPSLVCTVEASDPAQVMEDFLHLKKKSYSKLSLRDALVNMAATALPEKIYNVEAPGDTDSIPVRKFAAEAGMSRLEAAHNLAGSHGYEVFFDWNADFVIRRDITDEDDDSWNPSAPGGDIGTVSSPVAVLRDGTGGNLVGMTTSVSRDGAANAVAINLISPRDKKKPAKLLYWQALATATGPIAYGDSFGRVPIVETKQVGTITLATRQAYTRRAKKLLKRRKGMLKYVDLDALPIPYLEPDDKVKITAAGATEDHYVQRVEFDLSGGPMHVRTRTLAVIDIMAPPTPGPSYYTKVMSLSPYWYLRFETATTIVDSAPYDNDFNSPDPLANTTWVAGLYPTTTGLPGKARSFDGTSFLEIGETSPRPTTNPFTFAAGVKFPVVPSFGSLVALTCTGQGGITSNLFCGLAGDGRPWMRCYSYDTDLEYVDIYGPAPLGGVTHHVAYSFHATTHAMKIYVDGVEAASGNLGQGLSAYGGARHVAGHIGGSRYEGTMDEAAWFDYCFTDAQVSELYAAWIEGS